MSKEIIYVGDPMCSWCYGFSPTIQEMHKRYGDKADFSVIVGGLRVGDEHVVDEERLKFLREHWPEIEERTGQKFNLDILKEGGWIYNTEYACRAVVTMRKLNPDKVFEYFSAVQKNFYAENKEPTDPETYADEAANFGVDKDEFLKVYNDEETKKETMADFVWAQQVGITGFPTVLVKEGDKVAALTFGYQPMENLEKPLEHWLEHGFPEEEAAE